MKRINPLFREHEHPFEALSSVCSILGFVRDLQSNGPLELSFSTQGAEGFISLITMVEDTIIQILAELEERDQKKPE